MPRKNRKLFADAIYHVYSRGNCKKEIFKSDKDNKIFLKICQVAAKKFNFAIFSYALMKNHYHFLIQTPDANLPEIMCFINRTYANYFNKEYQQVGYVFQGRYNAKPVEDNEYLRTLIAYINLNPYAANIVTEPSEYKWSSCKELLMQKDFNGFLHINYVLKLTGDFASFLEAHIYDKNLKMDSEIFYLTSKLKSLLNSEAFEKLNSKSQVRKLKEEYKLTAKEISSVINLSRSSVYRLI
jgi:REP element-mobilizing transposase RayT